MNHTNREMPNVDQEIPENAVSVFGDGNSADEFPVLKAFQQYIDAEQAKARKRMTMLCIVFGFVLFFVVAVFVALLFFVSARSQAFSDRLVEYALRDMDRRSEPSAVQPQPAPKAAENEAISATLTAKLEEMQQKLMESQAKAEKAVSEAVANAEKAAEAAKPKPPTQEQLEIERLKALLSAEKERQAAEKERLRQLELEEYRRKHYPELYEQPKPKKGVAVEPRKKKAESAHADLLKEVDAILADSEAMTYFDEDDETTEKKPASAVRPPSPPPPPKEYSIPVDIRGSSSRWNVPND